jgi:hypothetical protein
MGEGELELCLPSPIFGRGAGGEGKDLPKSPPLTRGARVAHPTKCTHMALLAETIALSVKTMALSVETMPLSVKTMPLSVETMALSVETMALLVETMALSVETIALSVKLCIYCSF